VVLGATNKNSVVPFGRSQLSLAEALGQSGGLDDRLANPYGVYVLRYEDSALAPKLGGNNVPDYLATGKTVPVVYQFNLKNGDGLLLAQSFMMHDRDLVYVSDSPSVQIGKLTGIFNSIGAIFKNNNFNAFRNSDY
jgi:polysaccharide export outer membrane protein